MSSPHTVSPIGSDFEVSDATRIAALEELVAELGERLARTEQALAETKRALFMIQFSTFPMTGKTDLENAGDMRNIARHALVATWQPEAKTGSAP